MRGKQNNFLLSLFSGLLLSVSWYWNMSILVFFALVPLLLVEGELSASHAPKKRLKIWGFSYLTFLIWNIGATWWVVYASFGGACIAFIFNALFMSVVFLIFSNIKRRINKSWVIWLLIPLWLSWEYLHSLWDLAWIWLTIGNVFSFNHKWIQWYEFTGTSGGSAWALAVNILVFNVIKNSSGLKFVSKPILKIAAAIILPIALSYAILMIRTPLDKKTDKLKTVVVQPNIDPYNDKFVLDFQAQFFKLMKLIHGKIDDKTEYLVLPETFIIEGLREDKLQYEESLQWFSDSLLSKYPNLKIVVGATSYSVYNNPADVTATSRKDESSGLSYDEFNTALQLEVGKIQLYHKSKLVPGVERMPFPALLKPLEKLALDMGGTTGSLGTQNERTDFFNKDNSVGVAPVVCYESVFSDYVSDYVRKGASLIFIITNDGWWEDTPGKYQHLNYARLRAIENRRQIARSANTGISCFVDELGNISQPTGWWVEAVIEKDIVPNKELTFFSRFGDILSRLSLIISALCVALSLFLRFKK